MNRKLICFVAVLLMLGSFGLAQVDDFSENFDGVSPPALPTGWGSITRTQPGSSVESVEETAIGPAPFPSSPNCVKIVASGNMGDFTALVTPVVTLSEKKLLSYKVMPGAQGKVVEVGVTTDATDASDYQVITSVITGWPPNGWAGGQYVAEIGPVDSVHIVIRVLKDPAPGSHLLIDNIELLEEFGTLAGTVTDSESGDPLEGATVIVGSSSVFYSAATSNADGKYSLDLPAGTYSGSCTRPLYQGTEDGNWEITVGDTTTIDFQLELLPPSEEFREDFSGATAPDLPEGWTSIVGNTPSNVCINTSGAPSPGPSAPYVEMTHGPGGCFTALVTPRVSITENRLLRFRAACQMHNSYPIEIGTITDPTNQGTFHTLKTVYVVSDGWGYFQVEISPVEETCYIAFRVGHNGFDQNEKYFIDDIILEPIPYATLEENFDEVTPPALPNGWGAIKAGESDARTQTGGVSMPGDIPSAPNVAWLHIVGSDFTALVTPSVVLKNNTEISFRASAGKLEGQLLEIGYLRDPFDKNTYHKLRTVVVPCVLPFPSFAVEIPPLEGVVNLAFRALGPDWYPFWIDDVVIQPAAPVEYQVFPAEILSIVDIPNDQGRQVRITWKTPQNDTVENLLPTTQFGIWRYINGGLAKRINEPKGLIIEGTNETLTLSDWDAIGSVMAIGDSVYNFVAPTLVDSNAAGENATIFMVTTHTPDPTVWAGSDPASGYSVDNIPPETPYDLAGEFDNSNVCLTWKVELDYPDFSHYAVYRDVVQGFLPGSENLIAYCNVPTYTDTTIAGGNYYYKVSAIDVNDNESNYSNEVVMNLVGIDELNGFLPDRYALLQNYPNPFNPQTIIRYHLPQRSHVTLKIYDILGEEVTSLIDNYKNAGYHRTIFDASKLPSGIYYYRIKAGDYSEIKKMVLMK